MRAFKLTRYFSLLSMILLVLAGSLLGLLVRQQEIGQLERVAEDQNVNMTQMMGLLLRQDIERLIARSAGKDKAALQTLPDIAGLRDKLSPLIRGSEIAKVKIYSLQGNTVFSTETSQIGEDKSHNSVFLAARSGRVVSELVHRNQFSASEGVRNDVDLLSSYVPVIADGRVVAVFELYQDVTRLMGYIERSLWQIWATLFAVFAALYLMLLLVVRHAQSVLGAQEALLADANRELDRRVAERTRELEQSKVELGIAAVAFESQQSMLVSDADNVILRVNKAFTETTGYTAEEVIGKTPRLFQSGRHDRAFYAAIWESIDQTGYWQGELWDKRKNGEVFPKWLTISAVKDAHGAVTHYVGTYIDITERKQADERIRKLAFFDQLTGLPNRTLLLDRLQQAESANARSDGYGALFFIDLDHFKALNDMRGHASGDKLLQQVARRLSEDVRQGDTVARLGSDEFVVMLPSLAANSLGTAAVIVETVCQKLLAVLAQPYALVDAEFHCTASIGISLFKGQETSIENVLRQAGLAMYQSKNAGGNTYAFFDPAMESAVLAHAQMESDLRQAIQAQQFELYYQAQVDGQSGRILGAEALIRWKHPERGMVSPVDFIPHAERTGMILPLGQWVLETACTHLAAWAAQPEMAHLTVAVNVSAQQFQSPDFVDQVIATLERTGANPRQLKLELTESVFASNADEIVKMMTELKAMGVGFSLDDFGTGYSSLAYLSRLPLDQLKIDRSFVIALDSGDNNIAICAATISLAHSLKLKVVAEGVETEAQRHFLSTVHHCDMLQGYLFSRPLPHAEFEKLLQGKQPVIA